jgi:hypothetical protein
VQQPLEEDVMSQTSEPGSDGATAGESPTDEVAEQDDRRHAVRWCSRHP